VNGPLLKATSWGTPLWGVGAEGVDEDVQDAQTAATATSELRHAFLTLALIAAPLFTAARASRLANRR
jgi:hypothetical protein